MMAIAKLAHVVRTIALLIIMFHFSWKLELYYKINLSIPHCHHGNEVLALFVAALIFR